MCTQASAISARSCKVTAVTCSNLLQNSKGFQNFVIGMTATTSRPCDVVSLLYSQCVVNSFLKKNFKKENRMPLEPQQNSLEWAWRGALSGAERQQNLIDYTEKEQDIS